MSNPTEPREGKRWPCLTCAEPIQVNPFAGLGEPRYRHLTPSGHLALRGPNARPVVEGDNQ